MRVTLLSFYQPRQPEISQMRFAVRIEENVARFDIAMQHTMLVRVVHRARHFRDQF